MNKGVTRIVFPIGRYVIKIPNFLVQHDHFLMGCVANYTERKIWKAYRSCQGMPQKDLVIPSSFCSWFGLIQIQHRAVVRANDNHLTDEECEVFKYITHDTKASNFGYYKGRLVCIDYGQK